MVPFMTGRSVSGLFGGCRTMRGDLVRDRAAVEPASCRCGRAGGRSRPARGCGTPSRPAGRRRRAGTASGWWCRPRTAPGCRGSAAGTCRRRRSRGRPAARRGRAPGARLNVPHLRSACVPRRRGARDADRDAAGDELGREVVGLAGVGVDERVARHRLRRGLAAVDGADAVRLRVVVDEVATATQPGAVGLGHAERSRGRDGGVDRVAAVLEHPQADPGRLGVDRGDRAAEAGARGRSWWCSDRLTRRPGPGGRASRDPPARSHRRLPGRRDGAAECGHGRLPRSADCGCTYPAPARLNRTVDPLRGRPTPPR